MSCKFFIKNNEQEFKDSYFQAIKKDEYVYITDFNYYLITEKNELEKHYLYFSLNSNRTKKYTNILYLVSNRFGDYVCKQRNTIEWSKRYLMLIKDNYYFYILLYQFYIITLQRVIDNVNNHVYISFFVNFLCVIKQF